MAYCCAAWSTMTALCGMAGGYWSLALSTALCYLLGMLAFASALRHYKAPAAT